MAGFLDFVKRLDGRTPVDVDGIQAELKHGVLNLYVPKAETAKTRKIQIKSV